MRSAAIVVVLVAVAACTGPSDAAEAPVAALPADRAQPIEDTRTQYEFAVAVVEARAGAHAQPATALETVRRAWHGRRYTWDVALSPALCRADFCVVLPFDHGRDPERPILQGWLPRLELDDADRTALLERCRDREACVLTMTATLRELRLSVDEPTSLTFADVDVVATRDVRPGESWVVRPSPRRRVDPSGVAGRTSPVSEHTHG